MIALIIHVVQAVAVRLGYLPGPLEICYHILSLGLWAISVTTQASADMSDPDHTSSRPWYLARSCSRSWENTRDACRIAQATFVLSIIALVLAFARVVMSAMTMLLSSLHPAGGSDLANTTLEHQSMSDSLSAKEALSPVLAFFPTNDRAQDSLGMLTTKDCDHRRSSD